MLTWNEFAAARPDLAEVRTRALATKSAVGEGHLATVRPDGAPRIRPICPLLTPDGSSAFIMPVAEACRSAARRSLRGALVPDS